MDSPYILLPKYLLPLLCFPSCFWLPSSHILVKIFTKFNSKYFYYIYYIIKKWWEGYCLDYKGRMRNLREDSDYTQEYVASYLGTSQTMYARYERGANELPIRHLIALCSLYQVSSDYLLGLTNKK